MSELTLKQEVLLLRSAVVGLVGKDKEGQYRPELVKSVLADLNRKATHNFVDPESFLEEVKRA
jgi:hypothetical protein